MIPENSSIEWFRIREFEGTGWIGGSSPVDPNPNSPDGRTKVRDEPTPLEVRLLDSKTRRLIDSQRSKPDGTWRFDGLRLGYPYAVEFVNQNGVYTDNNGQPYNSFVQDFIYPVGEYSHLGTIWNHAGNTLSVNLDIVRRTFNRFRIIVYESFVGDGVSAAAEIALKNSEGGIFTPTMVEASSVFSSDHFAEFAFDGDISTWWASWIGPEPKWIEFNAPDSTPFQPATLDITCSPDATWGALQAFKSFDLQSKSEDNETWQTLFSARDLPEWSPNERRTFNIIAPSQTLTYDPLQVHNSISLSNNNTTAIGLAVSGGHVKGVAPKIDGKWYVEVNVDEISSGTGSPVGLVRADTSLNTWLGYSITSTGLYTDGLGIWSYWYAGSQQLSWTGYDGSVAMMAWDGNTGRIWYGVDGVWFRGGDPGADTNPVIETPRFAGASFHFASCPRNIDNQVTVNQTPQYTVPRGFNYWSV